jgi:hypothetical protein
MGWIGPVLQAVVPALVGAGATYVGNMAPQERAEDLANEQARNAQQLGAASLLEQQNFNAKQLALMSPGFSFSSNFAEDPNSSLLGADNLASVPGSANNLLNKNNNNNIVTWS